MKLRILKKQYKKFLLSIYGKNKENKKQCIFFTEKGSHTLNRFEFGYELLTGKRLKNPYDDYGRKKRV